MGATAPGTSKYEVNAKLIKLLGRPLRASFMNPKTWLANLLFLTGLTINLAASLR